MFINLEVLEAREIDFREEFQPDVIDLGPDLRQRAPLRTSGCATLIEEHYGHKGVVQDIRLVGSLATQIEVSCARCLEPVTRDVARSFDLLYRPLGIDAGHEELSVTDAEAEIGYYIGDGLLLEDVLREQLLLAVPIKIVCREDCRGLCPSCGCNLNVEKCACTAPLPDPRWAALQELKDLKDKLSRQ